MQKAQSKPSEVSARISSAHKRDTTAASRKAGDGFSVCWCVCPPRCASPRQFLGFGERGWRGQGFARVRLQLVNGGVGDGFEAGGLGLAAPCPGSLHIGPKIGRAAESGG